MGTYENNDEDIYGLDSYADDTPASPKKSKGYSNRNLTKAKKAKNDEFYTQLEDIEKELAHYDPAIFRDKVIYCPTDVATDLGRILQSNFVRYFQMKAEQLQFKELVATCLAEKGEEFNNKFRMVGHKVERKNSEYADENGMVYVYGSSTTACAPDEEYGSGDFRSEECTKIRDRADFIITNPPFSLFREFIKWCVESGKQFLLLGNQNALKYKEIFPLLKSDLIWTGNEVGSRSYIVPFKSLDEANDAGIYNLYFSEELGYCYSKMGNTCWFTNMYVARFNDELLLLSRDRNEKLGVVYSKYDNFSAINVDKTAQIPSDYDGVMGVPISFLLKYNPSQFEILGVACGNFRANSSEELKDLVGYVKLSTDRGGAAVLNGKLMYDRVLIRRRKH